MNERLYQVLKWVALTLALAWVGWTVWDSLLRERSPGDQAYFAAEKFFEDGEYERASQEYDRALRQGPNEPHVVRAKARTLMQLGRNDEALEWYNRVIDLQPYFGGTYANRGILYDRMGKYELAVADYEKSLQLDKEIGEGPHWLIRFLRNQPQKPPSVKERAEYLKQELAKPASERVLRVPEVDAKQRAYKAGRGSP